MVAGLAGRWLINGRHVSLQSFEIRDKFVQFCSREFHARHQASGFDLLRIVDPGFQIFGSVGHHACRQESSG